MLIRTFLTTAALLAVAPSHAQTTYLSPSRILSCLAPQPGAPTAPVYPEEAFKRKDGAQLSVELQFEGPDRPPKVDIARNHYVRDFDDAINNYAKHLRVPCMPVGAAPVTLKQDYVFRPDDGRKVMPPLSEDPADVQRRAKMACLTHIYPGAKPHFPKGPLHRGVNGKVMARMTFTSPNAAPSVEQLVVIGGREFRNAVSMHTEGLRLPCLDQGEVSIDMFYLFVINGSGKTVLIDMPLRDFIASAEEPAPLQADMHQMACPFDVRIQYLQPFLPNRVREVENSNSARGPVLNWLSTIRLRLPKAASEAVFADSFTVNVPCGKIDF